MATSKAGTKTTTKKKTSTAKKTTSKTAKPAAKKTTSVKKKVVAAEKTPKEVEVRKTNDIYNTNVSIILVMAIEALILLLAYLIVIKCAL